MDHMKIVNQKEPIRLFKSDFLEFFTHISPVVVLVIWLPVALYFLLLEMTNPLGTNPWFYIPICFLAGLFIWTLTEYILHRFLFHYRPRNKTQEKIFFLFHGVHHAQPQDKTRLVMPPVLSIPMAIIFYFFFYLLLDKIFNAPQFVAPFFSGFMIGYLIYDMMHYATHHFPMRSGALKYLKRYHMQHHYKTPEKRFGVSSPLWDIIFGTKPQDA